MSMQPVPQHRCLCFDRELELELELGHQRRGHCRHQHQPHLLLRRVPGSLHQHRVPVDRSVKTLSLVLRRVHIFISGHPTKPDYTSTALSDPLWLIKIDLQTKAGLIVRLYDTEKTTQNPNGFFNGKYEGQIGCVKTAAATATTSGGATMVTLESGEDIFPPPGYLVPVHPQSNGDQATMLVGPYAGQTLKLVGNYDTDTEKWPVMLPGGVYEEAETSHMCKYVPPKSWLA